MSFLRSVIRVNECSQHTCSLKYDGDIYQGELSGAYGLEILPIHDEDKAMILNRRKSWPTGLQEKS